MTLTKWLDGLMQVLPWLACLFSASFSRRNALIVVLLVTSAYVGMTCYTFVQAINGQPFRS